MKTNFWKNIYSGVIYEMLEDWLPVYDNWELVGKETK